MKKVFVLDGVVVGTAASAQPGAQVASTIEGAVTYDVDDTSLVDTGWSCTIVDDVPEFTRPTQ